MRGAVSLAAALALPLETDAGAPLAGRDLILFITFAVILVTVVGQGLTLPALIRRLGVQPTTDEEEERGARGAARDRRGRARRGSTSWPRRTGRARTRSSACAGLYGFRQRRFATRAGKIEDEDGIEDRSLAYQRLMHELYDAQRQALVAAAQRAARSPTR